MQLDRQRIVIRERSYVDLLDLALRVIRAYAAPLVGLFLLGVVPALILNAYLLYGLDADINEAYIPFKYIFYMLMLALMEAPLATAPLTLFLGHSLFMDKPRAGYLVKEFFLSLPQMLLFQGVLRIPLLFMLITWMFLFGGWPHISEVVLLERNPLFRRRPGQMTTFRRLRALHAGVTGDLFPRWLAAMTFGASLFASLWLSCLALCGMLFNEWEWEGPTFTFFFPLCMWIVFGFFTVVRYLGYLDLRIRREGWEVELLMRAEGARLTRQPT
ncbi:MAG: hypothetical protein IT426_13910 [Pirellulales bacterium]|nr:hypothetical protein [Pirellulales bacterium]